ncbi:MAG: hypothetical protein NTV46_00915 [Verrucomicrobia bacterium]|nr:hypothetical protein [Verrucomicrobiota bacterium]
MAHLDSHDVIFYRFPVSPIANVPNFSEIHNLANFFRSASFAPSKIRSFCHIPTVQKKSATLISTHPAPDRRTARLQTRLRMHRESTAPQAPLLSPPIAPRRRPRPSSFQHFSFLAFQHLPVSGCADDPKSAIAHPAFSFLLSDFSFQLFPPLLSARAARDFSFTSH